MFSTLAASRPFFAITFCAARDAQSDTESRYRLGATAFFVTLTAGQQYQNAHIQQVRARAARLADTAALFDSMGMAKNGYTYVYP